MDLPGSTGAFEPRSRARELDHRHRSEPHRQAQEEAAQATAEAARLAEQIARRDTELHAAQTKIQALTLELAHLRRMRFGARSEALSAQQRELFQETLASRSGRCPSRTGQATGRGAATSVARTPRSRAGRQPLPEHLPRIEHRHEPQSCTCGQCGQDRIKIGEDISEQLDVEPARFFVHRHIRLQYACRSCETVAAAPIPPAVIDGGMAAVGWYVWVIIGKYLDHLPLYRLEQIAGREEVALARSTLAEWVGRIGVALQPLADRLAMWLRERSVLHADETPVRQLDPGAGKTKRAYSRGLIAPTACTPGRRSSSSIIKQVVRVSMLGTSCADGTGT